ncbi:MAG: hypothetical protein HY381_01975 [Candidatus Chisholmbacteria bacterium]|nr:hypothetical protein [Candidatus Chisholmbacteria bacterium]
MSRLEANPPLSERVVVVGSDKLLPTHLTGDEARFILDAVARLAQTDEATQKAFYDRLATLEAGSSSRIIPISALTPEGEIVLWAPDDVTIFDSRDTVFVSLKRPTRLRARKQLKFWRKRFVTTHGRKPTEDEEKIHLKPGYQLKVLGWDDDRVEQLTTVLETAGFPVSAYFGLAEDDEPEAPSDELPPELTHIGQRGGDYRAIFEEFLRQIENPATVLDLVSTGKISRKLGNQLLSNEKMQRSAALDMTKAHIRDQFRTLYPNASEKELDTMMLQVDIMRLLGRL